MLINKLIHYPISTCMLHFILSTRRERIMPSGEQMNTGIWRAEIEKRKRRRRVMKMEMSEWMDNSDRRVNSEVALSKFRTHLSILHSAIKFHSTFSTLSSPLSALRSSLPAPRSLFSALLSPLSAPGSPISDLHSPLSVLRSPLSALHYPLSTLNAILPTSHTPRYAIHFPRFIASLSTQTVVKNTKFQICN